VAILGAGAAGMFVALAAQARGLRVVLFDPFLATPNNFAVSGGLFPAAGSRLQREAGVSEAPEAWLDDLRTYATGMVNARIFDESIERQLGNHSAYQQALAAGLVLGAPSVRELARLAGVDPVALEDTVADVNRFASGELADLLGASARTGGGKAWELGFRSGAQPGPIGRQSG
jgi:glycine/D-amino acid oxidase-like deaminating enzyme